MWRRGRRRILRCNATFGARRSDDGRERSRRKDERSRRKDKCLHAVDYSVEGRPTDKVGELVVRSTRVVAVVLN